jgi:hypothetical protein
MKKAIIVILILAVIASGYYFWNLKRMQSLKMKLSQRQMNLRK